MQSVTTTFGLVDRIKGGDREAFTPLFEKYRRRLAVVIHYRMGSGLRQFVTVDDILQEAFLKAFNDFDHYAYQGPGSFMRWISSIAEHIISDSARFQGRQKRRAREVLRLRSESNPDGPEPVDSNTPSRLLAEREDFQSVLQKLDELPEDYRKVIILSKVYGFTTEEVAVRLGKSKKATSLLLHRAIKRFRQLGEGHA